MFYLHKHNPFLSFHPRFQKLETNLELFLRGGCRVAHLSKCMLKRGGTGRMNRDKQGGVGVQNWKFQVKVLFE